MHLQAGLVLKRNIDALLRARGQTRHDLAMWCRRTDAWLSKIMDPNGARGLPLKYLDRISDFFGLAAYQLFQPGITPLLERRASERRAGLDRRVADPSALLQSPADNARELVRLLLTVGAEDRKAVYAQLLELGNRRSGAPSTGPGAAAHATRTATGRGSRSARPTR